MYYIINVGNEEMKMTHTDVFVLLSKCAATEYVAIEGIYAELDLAEAVMEELMDIHGEDVGFKIEMKSLVSA
jgi:hypothetical protein